MTVTRSGTSAHPKSRCDADLTMTTGELLGPKPPRATDTCNKVYMLRCVHLLYDSENEKKRAGETWTHVQIGGASDWSGFKYHV